MSARGALVVANRIRIGRAFLGAHIRWLRDQMWASTTSFPTACWSFVTARVRNEKGEYP